MRVYQLGQRVDFLPRTAVPAAGTTVYPLKLNGSITLGGSDAGPVTPTYANQQLRKLEGIRAMALEAVFEYGAAGTTTKLFLQSSFDGANWHDVACFAFLLASSRKVALLAQTSSNPAVATDGTLADDTLSGPVAPFWRVKVIVTGAYTTTFMTLKGEPLA